MNTAELVLDAFGRVHEAVHRSVDGLKPADLHHRIDPGANSIAWLVWHLTRVQDDHVSEVAGVEQVWTAKGFHARFALPFDAAETGYRQGAAEVARVTVLSGDLLTGYYDAVHEQTIRYVGGLTDADLDRVVDTNWDPPVTLGVRLVSVIEDDIEHAGQAAFLRGILARLGKS